MGMGTSGRAGGQPGFPSPAGLWGRAVRPLPGGLSKRSINCNYRWGLTAAPRGSSPLYGVPRAVAGLRPVGAAPGEGRGGPASPPGPFALRMGPPPPGGHVAAVAGSAEAAAAGRGAQRSALHRDGRGRGETGGGCGGGEGAVPGTAVLEDGGAQCGVRSAVPGVNRPSTAACGAGGCRGAAPGMPRRES